MSSDVIVVTLPRECSGQEILDAFRAAATFQETSTRKWEAHGHTVPSGVATGLDTFSQKRGYYATPAYLREQGRISRLFRGRRNPTWKTVPSQKQEVAPFETQIKLLAIQPETKCTAVEIAVTHLVILGGGYVDYVKVIHDPNDEEFASFRSAYDRIIREFLRRLERA